MHVDPNIWRTADLSTMQAKMDARMLKRVAHAYLGSNLLTISTKPIPEGKPILTVKTFEDIAAKCKRSLACLKLVSVGSLPQRVALSLAHTFHDISEIEVEMLARVSAKFEKLTLAG